LSQAPVLTFSGIAGDRNARAMRGAQQLGAALAQDLNLAHEVVGTPGEIVTGGWLVQLEHARDGLKLLSSRLAEAMAGGPALITLNRCAAGLATLPVVAERHPEAVIVWFDAHGDCNIPATAPAGDDAYLGGMVISGAAGLWETGLGSGLSMGQVILVGSRDLDAPEQGRVDKGELQLVEVGPRMGERLRQAIAGRPVYIHFDCDVMDAGLVSSEFQVPGGLTFDTLAELAAMLAEHEVAGMEIAEFEGEWPNGAADDGSRLISALRPLLDKLAS
jgi:arginase family enzyme